MTAESITRYVRYTDGTNTSFGILEGETIQQLDGDLLADPQPTGRTVQVSDVRLLVPIDASRVGKVIGVPGNYNRPDEPPRTIIHPRWFNKFPTSLNPHEGDVELPPGASNLNFEGELVVIIGKEGRFIPLEDVPDHVFGVTVGNDWSENTWMGERNTVGEDPRRGYLLEPNRMIAKSMDTWACMATTIVCGLAYDDYMGPGHRNPAERRAGRQRTHQGYDQFRGGADSLPQLLLHLGPRRHHLHGHRSAAESSGHTPADAGW